MAVSMRTLAATAILCVILLAAGLWAMLDRSSAPEVLTLSEPSADAVPPAADLGKFREAAPGTGVPELAMTDGDGRSMQLADLKGRVILLNLWATWCAPCAKEMPALDRLQAQLGGSGFEVVALSLDRGGKEQVVPFFEKTGVTHLAQYYDTASASMRVLSPRGLPTTLLIDRDGNEIGRIEGAVEWDSPEIVAFLRKHLDAEAGAAERG